MSEVTKIQKAFAVKAPAELETARLILLKPQADDAASIFERYASDPEVTRYLGWRRHESLADTREFLQFSREHWTRWPAGPYLICSRKDGQLLGSTGLQFENPEQAVTGYVLAKDAWGQGYATESLRAMVEVANLVGVVRLHALCHPEHRASWRVLEKCGFSRDADCAQPVEFPNLAGGVSCNALCYSLTCTTTK